MIHGSQEYFLERARFERRLSLMTLALSVALFTAILIFAASPLARRLNETEMLEHFGFEGPERYVRRIELQADGDALGATRIPLHAVAIPETHRGGKRGRADSRAPNAEPAPHRGPEGPGDAAADLMARALRRAGDTPVFQSEELVIEELVRPVYPEEARDHGIEGRVALMALVDTLGRVVNVDLVSGEEGGMLERASAEAVWRCRFRPYRVSGAAREVYAVFRFAFRLTER